MIVKLYLMKNDTPIIGYINKNKSGEYFPSVLSMGIFKSMEEVDHAVQNLKLKPNMELTGYDILDHNSMNCDENYGLIHELRSRISNLLDEYEIYSVVYVGMKPGEVNISFDNFQARFKTNKIFHITQPYHGKFGSTNLNGNYPDKLVEDLIKLVFELIY